MMEGAVPTLILTDSIQILETSEIKYGTSYWKIFLYKNASYRNA